MKGCSLIPNNNSLNLPAEVRTYILKKEQLCLLLPFLQITTKKKS
jgi:hypothetical protein